MNRRKRGYTLVELMLVIGIIAVLAAILLPNFTKARSQAQFTSCQQNLATLAKAMESYAIDNAGQYPVPRRALMPTYLSVIPTCPSTGGRQYIILATSPPDANYSIYCGGVNHDPAPLDYPRYTGTAGLEAGL